MQLEPWIVAPLSQAALPTPDALRARACGTVGAIAFDPAPIHAGKIESQVKRHTTIVGARSVREVIGTDSPEGATTGHLVTTSNYGPDTHE